MTDSTMYVEIEPKIPTPPSPKSITGLETEHVSSTAHPHNFFPPRPLIRMLSNLLFDLPRLSPTPFNQWNILKPRSLLSVFHVLPFPVPTPRFHQKRKVCYILKSHSKIQTYNHVTRVAMLWRKGQKTIGRRGTSWLALKWPVAASQEIFPRSLV